MIFDEALQQHKDNLTKNLSQFGEGHRLNRMHREIDSNAADYEYYFNAGQQSQQAKVEELEHKSGLRESDHKALLVKYQATKKCWEDISKEKEELQKRVDSIKQLIQDYLDEEKELELKEWEQSTIYGRIAIELEQVLKGES